MNHATPNTTAVLFNKLQSVANIGTWEVDLKTNTLAWSSQTRRIHDVADDFTPTLDNAIEFYKEGNDRERITEIISHAITTGEPWTSTLTLVTAKGKEIFIETHGMVDIVDGVSVRLFGTVQNVDKSVKLRMELDRRRREAERMLHEREALLSRISHELRTPLNGISGMLQTLKFEERALVREQKTDHAIKSTDRLVRVVNDVLDYTEISNGKFALEMNDFCLRACLEDIVNEYERKCHDKQLRLYTTFSFPVKTIINSDATRICQIITNLLSNAIKFCHEGHIALQVALKKRADGLNLLVSIEDTGEGMSQEMQTTIFTPFVSVDNAQSEISLDTGLGLPIVNKLVEKMEGEIDCRSALTHGTCFDIIIPVHTSSRISDEVIPVNTPNGGIDPRSLSILVVDDNDINRLVIGSMLEDIGCTASEAENGEIAVMKARATKFDLIFMDCAMPVLDGMAASRIIRGEGTLSAVGEVVAVTANTSESDKKACFNAGMSDFISKPVSKKAIKQQIDNVLSRKHAMITQQRRS
ncbi:response regulator [Alteromonas sp. A079]|uniref:response regulator n=1 Tax=Alteromonas sp. A079 TaxID=3410268 RepID=UPI003BA07B40